MGSFCQYPGARGVGLFASSAKVISTKLVDMGVGDEQACYGVRPWLPTTLSRSDLNCQRWFSDGLTNLKNGVSLLKTEDEQLILHAILKDLNSSFGLELPVTDTSTDDNLAEKKWRVIFVGASHADRLCQTMSNLNMMATTLSTPNWRPTKDSCKKLETDLEDLLTSLEPDDCTEAAVVFCTLDKLSGRRLPLGRRPGYVLTGDNQVPVRVDAAGLRDGPQLQENSACPNSEVSLA
jgi:hypothetical protein